MFKNPWSPAQRMQLRNVDSILSSRWWPRNKNLPLFHKIPLSFGLPPLRKGVVKHLYLRSLREFSSDFSFLFLWKIWILVHSKNFWIYCSSISLCSLILWLQCIIWIWERGYFFWWNRRIKRLDRHMLSTPLETPMAMCCVLVICASQIGKTSSMTRVGRVDFLSCLSWEIF